MIDERVFFLDIIGVAISKRFTGHGFPVMSVFIYDGCSSTDERDAVMTRLNAAEGARVLLASRVTGGEGLNLQSANALLRCGPWWKVSWEEQAE